MPATVVVGAQWGDEGKGKVVDLLAERSDVVARYQGGNNAGHTIVAGDQVYKLHLVPSGILYPGTLCVIGNGTVVDPGALCLEIDSLEERGVSLDGLRIGGNAHLIMPYHVMLDGAAEMRLGRFSIGTTRRGHRPLLRGQGRAGGHPGAGPPRSQDPGAQARDRARGEERDPGEALRAAPARPRGRGRGAARATPSGCGPSSPTPRC